MKEQLKTGVTHNLRSLIVQFQHGRGGGGDSRDGFIDFFTLCSLKEICYDFGLGFLFCFGFF